MTVTLTTMKNTLLILASALTVSLPAADTPKPVGTQGVVGTLANPKTVARLEITKPGVYENYLVDAQGAGGNIVKVSADNVTIRHCEIRNATGNAIGVFGTKVVIENCRIHHLLNGSFKQQTDAHGVTGRWGDVTIRNCDISYVSGDCVQFDPDRKSQGSVVIEDCNLWTGPLPADALGFKTGERPGENAFDSKTMPDGERCKLIVRNCHLHGWNQPSQIDNMAALNLKERVDAEITHCVFSDNENAFRVRGPGKRGGAHVIINDCAVYDTKVAVRAEDMIEQLKINRLAIGPGVGERLHFHGGKPTSGFDDSGELDAPPMESLLKNGFPSR
jgi:hypothetical protein